LEGNYRKLLSWHFPGNPQLWWPQTNWDLNYMPPKYRTKMLPLHEHPNWYLNMNAPKCRSKFSHWRWTNTYIIHSMQMEINPNFRMKHDDTLNLLSFDMLLLWEQQITDGTWELLICQCSSETISLTQSFLYLHGRCVHESIM
jgi:hypothetical protein